MSVSPSIDLPDETATIELGRRLGDVLPAEVGGWTILLKGELGSGKSTLARALIGALGHTGPVPSPTYTLVEPYALERGTVYHVDLYRVSDPGELYFLGWDGLDTGLRLVEWPDRAPGIEKGADLEVDLDYAADGRKAAIRGLSPRGTGLAQLFAP